MDRVAIGTDWIRLDQVLKVAGWAQTGGEAKMRIQAGEVRVNGGVETRRGRKLRPGDRVEWGGRGVEIVGEGAVEGEGTRDEGPGRFEATKP